MKFSAEEFNDTCRRYGHTWRLLDKHLYSLCQQHPEHTNLAEICAKIWIIGRTYATGIERKIPSDGTQGSSMFQLANYMVDCSAELDTIFPSLSEIAEPLTPEKLYTIIDLHGQFVQLLRAITSDAQSARSFCSKYMHFHCPAVPIIDNYASKSLTKLVRWRKPFQIFKLPPAAEAVYAKYVLRFWQLYQEAQRTGVTLTVKHLDFYLLETN